MNKRFLSVAVAGALSVAVIAGSVLSAAATGPGVLPTYTPKDKADCNKVYFATPGAWVDAETKKVGNPAGCYWWGGTDTCDSQTIANGHGWPGWKLYDVSSEEGISNMHFIYVPKDVPMSIFSNYFDGGMDPTDPAFDAAKQTLDDACEFWDEGSSPYYPQYWWDYMYEHYDENDPTVFEEFKKSFGIYASNFWDDLDYGSGIVYNNDNMVYVVNLDPSTMVISTTIVKEGKPTYDGEYYFYYGNGKYGIWPTLDLLKEQEGIEVDENGYFDETKLGEDYSVDQWGNIVRDVDGDKIVVYGDISGKYWSDDQVNDDGTPMEVAHPTNPLLKVGEYLKDTASGQDIVDDGNTDGNGNNGGNSGTGTTDPSATASPDATGASQSSNNTTGGNSTTNNGTSNGSIATGQVTLYVVAFVAIIAGIGVVYFVRKKSEK